MDPQFDNFLNDLVEKTLSGPGFIATAPKEKEEFKPQLLNFFTDLISDTLLRNLSEEQVKELQLMTDLGSEEAQTKIAMMSAAIPNFIFILQDRLTQASEEIRKTGKLPEVTQSKNPATQPPSF